MMDSQVRETLHEWAEEARVPPGLADRALRRRRVRLLRYTGMSVVAAAAVVAVAVFLPGVFTGVATDGTKIRAGTTPAPTDVQVDTDNSPPRRFVAAGRVAMSEYSIGKMEKADGDYEVYHRTWHVYSPTTGTYNEVPYPVAAVAPGLRQAAVLEWPLPAKRIGLLDLATREVTAWIDLEAPVVSLEWSPDGTKLLATGYDRDPTAVKFTNKERTNSMQAPVNRTGYYIVDAGARTAVFHPNPPREPVDERIGPEPQTDFRWTSDGSRIWESGTNEPRFYDLDGNLTSEPPGWKREQGFEQAGLSPDGKLYAATGLVRPGPQTSVRDFATDQVVGTQTMEQLVAWADDDHLIALKCAGACENEFVNAYVLVAVDGTEVAQLTGFRTDSQEPGAWEPVFTLR